MNLRSTILAGLLALGTFGAWAQGTVPVLMLSDIHFDPLHDPAKAERLAKAPVSEWDSILSEGDPAAQEGAFRAVQEACGARGVDTDYQLFQATLKGIRHEATGTAFVTLTGDLVVHNFECRYQYAMRGKTSPGYAAFEEKTAEYVMRTIENTLPNLPVYVANGNNDSSCGDYRMDAQDGYLKATSGAVISGLREWGSGEAKVAQADYETGGYFSVVPRGLKKTRLIVLNNLYLSQKYKTCGGTEDAAPATAELAWLAKQLTDAKGQGESAWVIGHIPPGVDAYSTLSKLQNVCTGAKVTMFLTSDKMTDVLVSHADVIRLAVFAHTHSDELRLLGDKVPVKLVASVSPVNGNRPTFTIGQVDAASATLVDYSVFVASNDTGKDTTWAQEYDFRQAYGVHAFNTAAVAELVKAFQADASGARPASRAYIGYFAPSMVPVLSFVWPQYACTLNHTTEESFKACVCSKP